MNGCSCDVYLAEAAGPNHRSQFKFETSSETLLAFDKSNFTVFSASKSNLTFALSYQKIADKYGLSLTDLALSFVNDRPFVTSNIIGATTLNQLKENIKSINNVKLSDEIISEINLVQESIPNPAP